MIKHSQWLVHTEEKDGQTCIHAHLSEDLDFSNLDFSLIDEDRKTIIKLKVTSREIYFCVNIGEPLFAQLGDSIKYVDGSGIELYS